MMSHLLYEERGEIAILTLNRPERHHALSRELIASLNHYLKEIRERRQIRVLIITGAGEKSFCAGADLKERALMTEEEVALLIPQIRDTFTLLSQLPQPVIAAINGNAFGGGMELALAADLRIMSEQAVMGLRETSLGIIPGAGGTQRLPRLVGAGRAKEIILTGRNISSTEALAMGLVNRVVVPDQVLPVSLSLAEEIARNAPLAIAQAKWAIDRGMEADLATGLEMETMAYRVLISTQDRIEGLQAFQEKRKPRFTGK